MSGAAECDFVMFVSFLVVCILARDFAEGGIALDADKCVERLGYCINSFEIRLVAFGGTFTSSIPPASTSNTAR